MKPTLANAAHTIVPAHLALLHRGLLVSTTDSGASWVAEDSGYRFFAEDPVTLQGLVALHDSRCGGRIATVSPFEWSLIASVRTSVRTEPVVSQLQPRGYAAQPW
jgi:hypothetical protein